MRNLFRKFKTALPGRRARAGRAGERLAFKKAQREYVLAHLGPLEAGPGRSDDEISYFFRPDQLLVREEYADQVRDILRYLGKLVDEDAPVRPDDRPAQPIGRGVVAGLRLVRLRPPGEDRFKLDTLATLRMVQYGEQGPDVPQAEQRGIKGLGPAAASLNHLVHLTGDAGMCPAEEPTPVPAGADRFPPPSKDTSAGIGVRVVVIDTALDEDVQRAHPWMTDVRAAGTANPQYSHRYDLHGTFIAGVIKTVAPGAEVLVRPVFETYGAALEADLVQQLHRVMQEDHPDVISLSAGTYTFENQGLLGLTVWYEQRMRHHKGVVLVAAAGNDTDRQPFWPAAAPFAVSVGALNRDLTDRAAFSNFGGWVDVYAPGDDIVNVFRPGPYEYEESPGLVGQVVTFTELASWSGTSFSTPVVAGLVAARMSHTGENGHDAAAALIDTARAAAHPGVGAVLLGK